MTFSDKCAQGPFALAASSHSKTNKTMMENQTKEEGYLLKGNKFSVGLTGNKKDKYVEAEKGTNLFFAIYKGIKKEACS